MSTVIGLAFAAKKAVKFVSYNLVYFPTIKAKEVRLSCLHVDSDWFSLRGEEGS
jgi:hypothetical protein